LEAARWAGHLKPGGKVVANSQKIDPMPVITGSARYPDGLEGEIHKFCPSPVIVDALSIASECGSLRSVNFVLLGAASAFMDFTRDEWMATIREATPPRALDVNIAAFMAGAGLGEKANCAKE